MLILASASPRRHELLLAAGIPHRVQPADIAEVPFDGEPHLDFARRMASEKAHAIPADPGDIVLGADTVVCCGARLFGKPEGDDGVGFMLRALSGRVHQVHTAICLRTAEQMLVDLASTSVEFAEISDDEIAEYTKSGEGRDKAGGYAIQGLASRFVHAIEGSYHNVVGLPVSLVYRYLRDLDYL